MTGAEAIDGVRPWRHDLAGCLHACAGTLFDFHGIDPLDALGAGWGFHYEPGDVRREEYYFPCPPGVSLFEAVAPHRGVRSAWRTPEGADEGWTQVRERVRAGVPVAVAVDNFHLPFRPAHRDVHANHLVIVYGFNDDRGTVRVLDAVPPRFDGDIRQDELRAARDSGNPVEHERDQFFTGIPIAHRWLDADFGASAEAPSFGEVLRRNLDGFAGDETSGAYTGLNGQRRFLTDMADRLEAGADVRDELFVVAGTVLAATGLHADWLAAGGLRELARSVERIAHHWTALRITAGGGGSAAALRRRARALHADQEWLLGELSDAIEKGL